MNATQAPQPGVEAAFVGLVALIVVAFEATWALVRLVDAMAHEGAHAIVASLSGRGVESIKLRMNGAGATKPKRGGGVSSTTAIGVVGYVGPSIFGLGAAKLVESGYITSMFWRALFTVVEIGLKAEDARILRGATHIPRLIWSLLWLAGALAALFIGGRMLVMPT